MEPGDVEELARQKRREAERQLLFGVLFVVVGLLTCVVLVGVWRGTIELTGTATLLGGIVTFIVGLFYKRGGEK